MDKAETVQGVGAPSTPANGGTLKVVSLASVEDRLATIGDKLATLERTTPIEGIATAITELQKTVADIRQQITAAAVEAVLRPGQKAEISGAPNIIVKRDVGELIKSGKLQPGQKLPGSDIIFVTLWEPANDKGERLGKPIASFVAPENLSDTPQCFHKNAKEIGELNRHGHKGWTFDRIMASGTKSYEQALFKGLKDGSALNLWTIPQLPIINGHDRDDNLVTADNLLVLHKKNDKDNLLYGRATKLDDFIGTNWLQSCTDVRDGGNDVFNVHIPEGYVFWDHKTKDIGRSCVRPSLALGLKHLVI